MLDKTCFPVGICPQGCNIYPDGKALQQIHLGNANFKYFGSQGSYFNGKNSRYPYVGKNLNCNTGAAFKNEENLGLVIITCSENIHATGRVVIFQLI